MLQPCGTCLNAKGVGAGVPARTITRETRPMEIVHMDLAGPYEPSMCGSAYLIMFVNRASWLRPYRIARISNAS